VSAATLALLALLAAAPDAGAPAPPAAQAADSALSTAERAISEARSAGAAGADLAAASALLDRARKARRAGELDDAKRLSDEAWELARKAREGAAARTRFSVGVGDGDETRIAVRSGGPVEVEAGAERLAVQAGQGVRARPGAKLEVGPLPAAPSLLEPADGAKVTVRRAAAQGEPVLAWSPVPGAASYEVRLSRDPDFKDVVLKLSATTARAPLRGTLPPGEYAWRAVAVDSRGLAGPASAPRRLEVVERPPRLEVDQPVWK
jgi:hypothetical protein